MMDTVFPRELLLWNHVTRNAQLMTYRERIVFSARACDADAGPKMALLHREVSCGNQEAAFLKGIVVRVNGHQTAVRMLAAATLSVHVDGENVLMEEIQKLRDAQVPVAVLGHAPGISCLFQAKAIKDGEQSYIDEPSLGFFLPNGSLITAMIDEFKSPTRLGAEITIDVFMGVYSLSFPKAQDRVR